MSDQATIERDIRAFLGENFPLSGSGEVGTDDSLLELGVIDSTGVLELIEYLESTFDIVITDEEVLPDNLDTISRMVAFVSSKQQANGDVAGGLGAS